MLYLADYRVTIPQIHHCGTHWMWHALTEAGVSWERSKPIEGLKGKAIGDAVHGIGEIDPERSFVFVRHPVSYLRALWSQRSRNKGWGLTGDVPDLAFAQSRSLSEMLLVVADKFPGYCGQHMLKYTGKCHRVCRIECGSYDLVQSLRFYDVPHDPTKVYMTEPVRQSTRKEPVSDEAVQAIVESEAEAIERYEY